ncbi:uncharacterized protein LOC118744857 isoform X2 [Rhagoletis pomonella]|uniref:uncharacterized protein LOC118744857 isoform X2 n=1 Tax=Rhagoletis pomonella TaxID=28610 RepID=UPI001781C390|nr:uncharacterized protein LOC118744857 isoform X2 [Rhagoletis pomonella]
MVPCAQAYYRQMIKLTGIDAEWNTLRWKVRNMRIALKKANDWLRSPQCESMTGPTREHEIERYVLSVCPYYKRLTEIFGDGYGKGKTAKFSRHNNASKNEPTEKEQSLSMMYDDDSSSQHLSDNPLAITPEQQTQHSFGSVSPNSTDVVYLPKKEQIEEYEVQQICGQIYKQEYNLMRHCGPQGEEEKFESNEFIKSFRTVEMREIELKRYELEKLKMQFDREKFNKEMELQEKRLKLEEEKLKIEERWQQKEFELKKLEIEKNERIAIYEIDKKYRNKPNS